MNLVLLTEGTGQGVHGRKTNVSRVYDLLVENANQRINLESGPGTHFPRALGTFFGRDATAILNHHQNWFLNHAPRTENAARRRVNVDATSPSRHELKIFLFGFSRGALIMRVFAEWLCQRGFPVEYMGLWDTVDSTAGIKGEDYVNLPTNVKFARHAVARDEFRRFFNYLPLKPNPAPSTDCASNSRRPMHQAPGTQLEELLFPGCHSDVGGLYDDNHAIADVTLDWILEPAVKVGLKGSFGPRTVDIGQRRYVVHDSLREPTNGWGLLDPVKRVLDGIRRHPLCEHIQIFDVPSCRSL